MNKQELLSAAKPILFNPEMVRAILDGRKSCTRRLIKPQPPIEAKNVQRNIFHGVRFGNEYSAATCDREPKYNVGDILYVRETWAKSNIISPDKYLYKADYDTTLKPYSNWKWSPSIHMPKSAARIILRVTGARAERLLTSFYANGSQSIKTIMSEGIKIYDECIECLDNYGNPSCIYDNVECHMLDEQRYYFSKLWDSTIKKSDIDKYGWKASPWVWVYEFERIGAE